VHAPGPGRHRREQLHTLAVGDAGIGEQVRRERSPLAVWAQDTRKLFERGSTELADLSGREHLGEEGVRVEEDETAVAVERHPVARHAHRERGSTGQGDQAERLAADPADCVISGSVPADDNGQENSVARPAYKLQTT